MFRIRELCRPLSPGAQCRPGQPRFEGPLGAAIETGRTRLLVLGGLFFLAFALVGGRLVDVTLLKPAADPKRNVARAAADPDAAREFFRGEIADAKGELLATNIVTWSLYADPKMILDPAATAARLVRLFPELDRKELAEKLKPSDKRFVWLRRHLTPKEYQEVIAEGLPGIGARKDRRRVYPHGSLGAHVVGYADIDNHGIAGVERQFDGRLKRGERIQLSLDLRVQHVLREELAAAVKRHHAIGAMGVILDVHTGETKALVSLPEFDPHEPGRASEEGRFNRVTLGTYEMGSTFKILNTAMALDSSVATLTKVYDARFPLKHGKFTINDYHGKGRALSVTEIFQFSSNIGSAKMAIEAGTPRQRAFMGRAGMLKPVSIELPEIGAPLYPRDWKPLNTITISYGHGISVTPLHLAAAVAGIVNDGKRAPVTLVKRDPKEPIPYVPVVNSKTSAEMRQLMRLVVEKGTGKRAEAPGYFVGGKTGTADKSAGKKGYRRNTRISSFVAAFPMNAPRYVVLVMIDEPKASADTPEATGGAVAAPVVREVVLKAAPLLGVLPAENTSELTDEKRPGQKAPAKPPAKPAAKPAPPAAGRLERAATE
ncbi:MAG: penicillin-binding protein 2 [Candidatus Odyssella sp.]|nr:penicillin-binding protein 2 [Candidatus Odyssella sp.]